MVSRKLTCDIFISFLTPLSQAHAYHFNGRFPDKPELTCFFRLFLVADCQPHSTIYSCRPSLPTACIGNSFLNCFTSAPSMDVFWSHLKRPTFSHFLPQYCTAPVQWHHVILDTIIIIMCKISDEILKKKLLNYNCLLWGLGATFCWDKVYPANCD